MCCFKPIKRRILEQDEIKELELYSSRMKKTLALIEEGNTDVQAEDDADLLKADHSDPISESQYSPRTGANS